MNLFLFFQDGCEPVSCVGGGNLTRFKEGKSLQDSGVSGIPKADSLLKPPNENAVMATTSVFVVEPGEEIGKGIFKFRPINWGLQIWMSNCYFFLQKEMLSVQIARPLFRGLHIFVLLSGFYSWSCWSSMSSCVQPWLALAPRAPLTAIPLTKSPPSLKSLILTLDHGMDHNMAQGKMLFFLFQLRKLNVFLIFF